MTKKKLKPVFIGSREGMHSVVAQVVTDKLAVAALTVEMEERIAAIQKEYQTSIDDLNATIQANESGVYVWMESNKNELGDKKSIDLSMAVVGYRTTPVRVEKIRSKDTETQLATRMASIVIPAKDGQPAFHGEEFVRYADPKLDKEGLLAERARIPAEVQNIVGFKFAQDETFYITPKSQVLEPSKKEAA